MATELTTATRVSRYGLQVSVVAGGSGNDAWAAKIIGTHPTYRLDRTFCEKEEDLSGSRRSGRVDIAFDGDGLYQYGNISRRPNASDRRRKDRGFVLVLDGDVTTDIAYKDALKIAALLDDADFASSNAEIRRIAGIS